jgi:hypothetical protein
MLGNHCLRKPEVSATPVASTGVALLPIGVKHAKKRTQNGRQEKTESQESSFAEEAKKMRRSLALSRWFASRLLIWQGEVNGSLARVSEPNRRRVIGRSCWVR